MVNSDNLKRRRARDSYKYSRSGNYVLGIFRSNKHIHAYLINSANSQKNVLFGISTLSKHAPEKVKSNNNIEASIWVGNAIADKLHEMSIPSIVFNKSGYRFHGRIEQIAKTIRERGITC